MRVAVERSLGVAVLRLVPGQVPDDESLVSATGKEHVGAAETEVRCKHCDSKRMSVLYR